jgi:hypothetical protein
VCSFIRLRLRRRALVVFLTALDDPALAESFVRSIELVSHQHLILVNVVQPPGAVPLFSDPNVSDIDDLYERLGGHLRWHNLLTSINCLPENSTPCGNTRIWRPGYASK